MRQIEKCRFTMQFLIWRQCEYVITTDYEINLFFLLNTLGVYIKQDV